MRISHEERQEMLEALEDKAIKAQMREWNLSSSCN